MKSIPLELLRYRKVVEERDQYKVKKNHRGYNNARGQEKDKI